MTTSSPPALPPIATGFVRKLYRILDQESAAIISWDLSGASFSVRDGDALETQVLPRYFRGRLSAFRQQLREHGFTLALDAGQECYSHAFFRRGCPEELHRITHSPLPRRRPSRSKKKRPALELELAGGTKSPKKVADGRGVHRVSPYPAAAHEQPTQSASAPTSGQDKPQPILQHAKVDPAALATNPLFAPDTDNVLGSLMQELTAQTPSTWSTGCNAALSASTTGSLLPKHKDTPLSDDLMDTLLTMLSNSLSTDCEAAAARAGSGATTAPTATVSAASANSSSSTGSSNIFAPLEGRPAVVLPPLPPGIVETQQFSEDTLNCLMRWASASDTCT